MANDISSMIMATVPRPANETSQYVKSEAVKVPNGGGQVMPDKGMKLPHLVGSGSVSKADLDDAVSQINSYVQNVQRDLSFSVDEGSGRTIIKVIDSESGKLVRQIPSEEVLALATYLQDVSQDTVQSENVPQGILFSDST